jgi:predicted O-methyltransferase YrrM
VNRLATHLYLSPPPFLSFLLSRFYLAKFVRKSSGSNWNLITELVDFAYQFKVASSIKRFSLFDLQITPIQVKEEITHLLELLRVREPRVLMEIGTAQGGTLFLFCQIAPIDATIISIDLPHGRFGGGYPSWKIPLYKAFAKAGQQVHLLRADSHSPETLHMVEKILEGRKLDFLFIDGDHTYEGVKKDFEMYSPFVREGGLIAFHDIVEHPPETGCEVSRFWNEIKAEYKYVEIVKDWNQRWAGIGILYV